MQGREVQARQRASMSSKGIQTGNLANILHHGHALCVHMNAANEHAATTQPHDSIAYFVAMLHNGSCI